MPPVNRYLRLFQETLSTFGVSPEHGLSAPEIQKLRAVHGYNEFSVSTPEPPLLKFAKTIYESPLILLLCGSAMVSALMGNIDDAISITVAVLIVLTGEFPGHLTFLIFKVVGKLGLFKNAGLKRASRR